MPPNTNGNSAALDELAAMFVEHRGGPSPPDNGSTPAGGGLVAGSAEEYAPIDPTLLTAIDSVFGPGASTTPPPAPPGLAGINRRIESALDWVGRRTGLQRPPAPDLPPDTPQPARGGPGAASAFGRSLEGTSLLLDSGPYAEGPPPVPPSAEQRAWEEVAATGLPATVGEDPPPTREARVYPAEALAMYRSEVQRTTDMAPYLALKAEERKQGEEDARALGLVPRETIYEKAIRTSPAELRPGAAATFTPGRERAGPLRQLAEGIKRIPKAIGADIRAHKARKLADQAVKTEVEYRRKRGLIDFDSPITIEDEVRQALEGGHPFLTDEGFEGQKAYYEAASKVAPQELPKAEGWVEKAARFGGGVAPFIAEITILRRVPGFMAMSRRLSRKLVGGKPPVRPGGRNLSEQRMQVMPDLERASRIERVGEQIQTTMAVGVTGALGGEDPVDAMISFLPLAAIGLIRTPVAKQAAMHGLFGGGALARGGDLEDIIIEGVIGPLLFNARDLGRYYLRPRGAIYKEIKFWEALQKSDRPVEKLIGRWFDLQREIGKEVRHVTAEGEPVMSPELTHAVTRTAQALTMAYEQTLKPGKSGLSEVEVTILREFVKQYHPETVYERFREGQAAGFATEDAAVRAGMKPAGKPTAQPDLVDPARPGSVPAPPPVAPAGVSVPPVKPPPPAPVPVSAPEPLTKPLAEPPAVSKPKVAVSKPGPIGMPTPSAESMLARYGKAIPDTFGREMSELEREMIALRARGPEGGGIDTMRALLSRAGIGEPDAKRLAQLLHSPAWPDRPDPVMAALEQIQGLLVPSTAPSSPDQAMAEPEPVQPPVSAGEPSEPGKIDGSSVEVTGTSAVLPSGQTAMPGMRHEAQRGETVDSWVAIMAKHLGQEYADQHRDTLAKLYDMERGEFGEDNAEVWLHENRVPDDQHPEVLAAAPRSTVNEMDAVEGRIGGRADEAMEEIAAEYYTDLARRHERGEVPIGETELATRNEDQLAEGSGAIRDFMANYGTDMVLGKEMPESVQGLIREQFGTLLAALRSALTGQIYDPNAGRLMSSPWSLAPELPGAQRGMLQMIRDEIAEAVGMGGMTGIPSDAVLGSQFRARAGWESAMGTGERQVKSFGRTERAPTAPVGGATPTELATATPQKLTDWIKALEAERETMQFGGSQKDKKRKLEIAVQIEEIRTELKRRDKPKPAADGGGVVVISPGSVMWERFRDAMPLWLREQRILVPDKLGQGTTVKAQIAAVINRARHDLDVSNEAIEDKIDILGEAIDAASGKVDMSSEKKNRDAMAVLGRRNIERLQTLDALETSMLGKEPTRGPQATTQPETTTQGPEAETQPRPDIPGEPPAAPPGGEAGGEIEPDRPPSGGGPRAPGQVPTEGVSSPGAVERPGAAPGAKGGGGKRPVRAPVPGGVAPAGGGGTRPAGESVSGVGAGGGGTPGGQPTGDGGRTADVVKAPEDAQPTTTSDSGTGDYIIRPDTTLFDLGPKTQIRANIAAIELAKRIAKDERPATLDEMAELVKYTGWGTYKNVFNRNQYAYGGGDDKAMQQFYDQLKELLTEEEYTRARASVTNAMYTPPAIVRGMYETLIRMGFEGGRVLEPALGVGHFFGMMPPELSAKVSRTGIELDTISGTIAKLLYPNSDVRVQGYQKAALPRDFFDIVISNVPFAGTGVADKRYPERFRKQIHDYYFVRSADLVRPGGVVAFISSMGTMDKDTAGVRREVARTMDLLGAVRLFEKALPGTSVVADIIFLRKRLPGEKPSDVAWVETVPTKFLKPRQSGSLGVEGTPHTINEYFANNPDMVLGEHRPGTMSAAEVRLTVDPTRQRKTDKEGKPIETWQDVVADLLPAALAKLPSNVITPSGQLGVPEKASDVVMSPENTPRGSAFFPPVATKDPQNLYVKVQDDSIKAIDYVTGVIRFKALGEQKKAVAKGKPPKVMKSEAAMQKTAAAAVARMAKAVEVRDAALELLKIQLETPEPEAWKDAQKLLNTLYGRHATRFHDREWVRVLGAYDPHTLAIGQALETFDKPTATWKKGLIFERQVAAPHVKPTTAADAGEALSHSLAEYARVDVDYMAELRGISRDELLKEAVALNLLYETPAGEWQMRDEYLSGNVRKKLEDALAAADADPRFRRNVEALTAVQPPDKEYVDIDARLGSPFIDTRFVQDFAEHLFSSDVEITRVRATGVWHVGVASGGRKTTAATQRWGTTRKDGPKILEAILNLKDVVVRTNIGSSAHPQMVVEPTETAAARAKKQDIQDDFATWIWVDNPRMVSIRERFNREYNNTAPRQFDGVGKYLTLPGLSPLWKLRPYQADATAANLLRGFGLMFEPPGAGKTLIATATAVESIRLGRHKKVAIVVQGSTLDGFARISTAMYPAFPFMKITPDMLTPSGRRQTLARLAFAEQAVVIMTHESFKKISMGPVVVQEFYDRQLAELRDALAESNQEHGGRHPSVREIEAAIAALELKLQKQLDSIKHDEGITFEEIGIDAVIYDEAQKLKNLKFRTTMQNTKGLGSASGTGSGIAFDAKMKIEYLQSLNGGRGVWFSTATPISNSLAEMYNLQKFMDPKALADRDIKSFDDWTRAFAEVGIKLESVSYETEEVTGGETTEQAETQVQAGAYKPVSRLRFFTNLDELLVMFEGFTHTVTPELIEAFLNEHGIEEEGGGGMPKLAKNSEGKREWQTIESAAHPAANMYMRWLRARVKAIKQHGGKPQPGDDIILAVMTDGRLGSVNVRLRQEDLEKFWGKQIPEHPEEKVNKVAAKVADLYHDERFAPHKATQAVFMNLGVPPERGKDADFAFDAYGDLIDKLVARGVPRDQIDYVQRVPKEQRQKLFDKVASGDIRVIIGSISVMGIGVNMQDRMIAAHFFDPPWTPDMIIQAMGRPIRGGNMWEEVYIYNYVQKGGMDESMYGLLLAKQRFLSQYLRGQQRGTKRYEDIDIVSTAFQGSVGAASVSPLIKDWTEARLQLDEMTRVRSHHERTKATQRNRQIELAAQIPVMEKELILHRREAQRLAPLLGKEKTDFKVTDHQVTQSFKDAGEWMIEAAIAWMKENTPGDLATMRVATRAVGTVQGEAVVMTTFIHVEDARHVKAGKGPDVYGFGVEFALDKWRAANVRVESPGRLSPSGMMGVATSVKNLLSDPQRSAQWYETNIASRRKELAEVEQEIGRGYAKEPQYQALTAQVELLNAHVEALGKPEIQAGGEVTLDGATLIYTRQFVDDGVAMVEFQRPGGANEGQVYTYALDDVTLQVRRRFASPEVIQQALLQARKAAPVMGQAFKRGEWDDLRHSLGYRESAWLSSMPLAMRADMLKWIREHGGHLPAWGMGGAFNYPDPRGHWQKVWDYMAQRLQTLPPGQAQVVADAIGRGIFGTDTWGIAPEAWRAIQRYHGTVSLAHFDRTKILEEVEKRYEHFEKRFGPGSKSEVNKMLNEVAEGERAPDELDAMTRKVFDRASSWMKAMTERFLDQPHLHRYAVDFGLTNLIDVIKRKQDSPGMYLRMVYNTERDSGHRPSWYKGKDVRRVIKSIQGGMFKHRKTADLWNVRNVDGTYTSFTDGNTAYDHALKQLNDKDLQAMWGTSLKNKIQLVDPIGVEMMVDQEPEMDFRVRLARTMGDWAHNIAILELYWFVEQTIAKSSPDFDDGYVKMPDHVMWGPLRGLYVPRNLADALMETEKIYTGLVHEMYKLYQYVWKSSKVVWNVATWGRNLLGLNFFWIMQGFHPVKDLGWFIKAMKEWEGPTWRKLVAENELHVGYSREELGKLHDILEKSKFNLTVSLLEWMHKYMKASDKLGGYYDYPDQLTKFAQYLKNTEGQGWTHEEALENLKGYPNYARIGDFAKALRNHVAGAPFTAFVGTSVQVNFHHARNKPTRLFSMWMLPGLVTMGTAVWIGIDDEEMDIINQDPRRKAKKILNIVTSPLSYMNRWFMPLLPWRGKDGRPMQLDLRWTFPLANDFRVATGPGGIGIPLLLSQPLTKTALELYNNRSMWTGYQITKDSDTEWENVKSLANHLFHNIAPLPTIATRGWQQIYAAIKRDDGTVYMLLLKHLFGITISSPFIRRADAIKLVRDRLGTPEADTLGRLIELYNSRYRRPGIDRPITGATIRSAARTKYRKEAERKNK